MGNIDEKTISLLLEKIDTIKSELSALEDEVKALFAAEEVASAEEQADVPVPEPVEETAEEPAEEPTDVPVPELVEGLVEEPAEEPAEEPVPELVEGPEPVEEPIEDTPLDITISDIEMPVPPVIEPADEPSGDELPAEEEAIAADIIDDIPDVTPVPERRPELVEGPAFEPVPEPVEGPEVRKAILDTAKADTAVMDVMAEKQAWRTDRPGMPVKNIISGISLNDRVLLINVLFREDPMLFQDTIAKLNAMGSLNEALDYISGNFPEWDLNSEPVYRLMMAVRRKLN